MAGTPGSPFLIRVALRDDRVTPGLLAFPSATILNFDGDRPAPVEYRDTDHFRITRDFLEAPERFFRYLFEDGGDDEE